MKAIHLLDLGDGLLWADTDYLTRHLRATLPTLRRWAYEDRWPRRKIRGRAYYLLTSAERSCDQRRPRHADERRHA